MLDPQPLLLKIRVLFVNRCADYESSSSIFQAIDELVRFKNQNILLYI